MSEIRNIGVFAHVDAGKTTLSERFLAHCGVIRETGSVDTGTAHTDRMDIERRRGISIRATCASMDWRGTHINLIDTPGHADFAAEVERALWAIDGAVLLLSGVEGVQPQTEALFDALSRHRVPTLLFINKMDREGASADAALAAARQTLSARIVDAEDQDGIHALLAEDDDQAMADYLEGRLYPRERLTRWLIDRTREGTAWPAWHGSALRDEGIGALLDAIVDYLPAPDEGDERLSGRVFAIDEERTLGRAAHVRLYSGTLHNRDAVQIAGQDAQAKVAQIRAIPLEGRGADLGALRAGEIGAVYGLGAVRVGQVLGEEALLPRRVTEATIGAPLLLVKVIPDDPARQNDLRQALEALAEEDPMLGVERYQAEMHLRVMGAVQLEVLGEQLKERFGIGVTFGEPNVIYRETIRESAVGFYAYTMPKPCWAVIKFQIDPLPRGSGIEYASIVPAKDIMPRYQHQVEQAIPLALRQGMLGWQVDDVRITLIGGEHHLIHTHPLDFIVATPIAFLDGMRCGGSTLLEPILSLRMTVPEECCGRVMSEIVAMRGEVTQSALLGDMMRMEAQVPLKTSIDFSVRLAAMTNGRGAMSVRLHGYRDCALEMGAECPRRGVHPLDTAKYILAARSALDGGIFDL